MRVCLVSASFKIGWGYQENNWATQLTRMGHTVRVLRAAAESGPPRQVDGRYGAYEVQPVRARVRSRGIYITRGDAAAIRQSDPELVLWFNPSAFFGSALVRQPDLADVPVVSFFSESLHLHEYDWRKRGISLKQRLHAVGYRWLRGRTVRRGCRRSMLIVGTTPTSADILLGLFRPAEREGIAPKMVTVPLGYDPDAYIYDPALRRQVRSELGVEADEVLVIMSTRFRPGRKSRIIEALVSALQQALGRGPRLKALVVGLRDNAMSRGVRDRLAHDPSADRFLCHEFADQKRLNALFNASDIAVFGSASISCQAALGTGLVMGAADEQGTTNFLVKRADQGFFYPPRDDEAMAEQLLAAAACLAERTGSTRQAHRRELAEASRWLGYDQLVQQVLDAAKTRSSGAAAAPEEPRPR